MKGSTVRVSDFLLLPLPSGSALLPWWLLSQDSLQVTAEFPSGSPLVTGVLCEVAVSSCVPSTGSNCAVLNYVCLCCFLTVVALLKHCLHSPKPQFGELDNISRVHLKDSELMGSRQVGNRHGGRGLLFLLQVA